MKKRDREPGLLGKLITIYFEQARRRKAIRLLSRQSWSVDFLCLLLVKSARMLGNGVTLEVVNKDGQAIRLAYTKEMEASVEGTDDSILNHLDDDAAVADFVARHGRR